MGCYTFILDLADAYLSVPIAAEERRFSCAQVADGVIVWRCLGFGGREYPGLLQGCQPPCALVPGDSAGLW
eukprot:3462078-Amphidinium_carterae.1